MVRNVKIISVFLAVVLIFSFPLSCFAAEDLSPGESLMWDNFFNTLGEINKVAVTCPKCGAGIRKKDGGTCPSCGFNASIDDGTVNNYRPGFEAGGGSASPGGVGRNPSGYSAEGKANVTQSGVLVYYVDMYALGQIINDYSLNLGFHRVEDLNESSIYASSYSGIYYPFRDQIPIIYKFTAPVSGVYVVGIVGETLDFGRCSFFSDSDSEWYPVDIKKEFVKSGDRYSVTLSKGTEQFFCFGFRTQYSSYQGRAFKYSFNSIPIYVQPLGESGITNHNKLTINNNTWNGNIYVDSSNKLTYIYPQYTVNNETKISNNPIIYNEETKQYYTYDQTTNNYYYITYGDPAPTPTPSPSPDPGGSGGGDNPSGGGSSGGGSGDTPSGSGSSWWEKLLDKLGSALIDGLLDAIKGILKLLFDLFSAILGWIIWLCSKVFDLFPFLPPGVGALLVGGVVVCFILAFIKFIRG